MPSISDVYTSVFPETSKIAPMVRAAFRDVDSDAREAGRRWGREIQSGLSDVDVKLKANTSAAKSEIDAVTRDREATVEVDADTSKAEAQIDVAARDRHSTINVAYNTVNIASSAVQAGTQAGSAMGGAMRTELIAAGVGALAAIASAASGLAGLIPAALGGAGLGIGTLVVGLDGVKDAWDAVGKAAKSSGEDQASKAKEVASATRSLRDAVRDEARAQQDVANARKDARQELEDLNLELRGGVIDETEAVLQAQKAREDLATGMYETSTDYQLAQLRVVAADQRVAESHARNIDLQEHANETRAKGVDGADNVVAANDRLTQTQERVATAQEAVNTATSKVSSSAQDAAEKMAALSPAGQALIATLQSMMPQFQAFKFAVQDALLTGLGPQIQQLATTYLPLLQGVMSQMATTMNQAFGSLSNLFQTPEMLASMQTIFNNISSSFATWSQSLTPLMEAFTKITEVGSTFLPQLASGAVEAARGFADFIAEASRSGQLQEWIQLGINTMRQLWDVTQLLGKAFLDLAPLGGPILSMLSSVLSSLLPSVGPIASAFGNWVVAVTPLLTMVGQLITWLMPTFIDMLSDLNGTITTSTGLFTTLNSAIVPASTALQGLISKDKDTQAFFTGMKKAITDVLNPLQTLVNLFNQVKSIFTGQGSAQANAQALLDAARNGTAPPPGILDTQVTPGFSGGSGSFGTPPSGLPAPGTPGIPVWVPSGSGGLGTLAIPAGIARGGWTPAPSPFAGSPATGTPAPGPFATQPMSSYMPPGVAPSGGAYPGDAALLSNVRPGVYSQDPSRDLLKGLSDCSSSIGDLVYLMDKGTTEGPNLSTHNAAQWLPANGFLPGMGGPGDFRVGYNSGHMQATLPGGTPWNWGSDAAAARGGVGGTGADDPAFTSHYYRPAGGGSGPVSATAAPIPGMPTGTPTDPTYIALSPNIPAGQKKGAKGDDSGGEQLGQDFMGGIAEIFGIDGSVFKDPTQFGLFKIFKGLMGLKPKEGGARGGDGASLFPSGGGGGGLASVLSMVPQAFGDLNIGSPKDAPGQFMPQTPGSGGGSAAMPTLPNPFAAPATQQGVAGPGNQTTIDMSGSNFGYSQTAVQDSIQQGQLAVARPSLRALP